MPERDTMAFQCVETRSGGVGFVPAPRFAAAAAEKFHTGNAYWLSVEPERSEKSHNHEFGWLKTAWQSLPESIAQEYPTQEHLRKRALVQAGFYDEQIIDAGSNAAAIRVSQGMKARPGEQFSMIFVRGAFVIVRTPKSQSRRAMGAADFNRSKQAIAEVIASLLGITADELQKVREAA